MKKIITAIGNEVLNKKLKNKNDFEVIVEDIQYKEGLTYGYNHSSEWAKKDLAEHYIEVVKKYYLNEYDPNKLYL